MSEFELIAHLRARVPPDDSVVVGIGDDAAVLRPRAGRDLVATTDTLIEGVHFRAGIEAADLGRLALAANLSDLAAMGATPRWALLSLTLPAADRDWLDGFLDGFLALAAATGTALAGGNMTRGHLSITVQALGEVEPERVMTRSDGRPGDRVVVTGTPGDAAAALEHDHPGLNARLQRPEPRLAAGRALAGIARCGIDISDGLLSDLAHLLKGTTGARLELDRLPVSTALTRVVPNPSARWPYQLSGGSDYELCVLVPPDREPELPDIARRTATPLTVIGTLDDSGRIVCVRPDGGYFETINAGWDHFRV